MNWITEFQYNGILAIALYWMPLAICLYGYTIRTWSNYQKDIENREDDGAFYVPKDRVGHVLGRALVTVIPIANLAAAAFDIGPKILRDLMDWLIRVFDRPLVPKKPKQE